MYISPKKTYRCQKLQEKRLCITNCYRNASQNYNEVSSHTSQNGHLKKKKKNPQAANAGEGVGRMKSSCTVGENVS